MDSYASFEGTILEVRRGYVRAVFSRSNSDKMEERGSQGTWRFDRYSPETTYQRQLKVDSLGPLPIWLFCPASPLSGSVHASAKIALFMTIRARTGRKQHHSHRG